MLKRNLTIALLFLPMLNGCASAKEKSGDELEQRVQAQKRADSPDEIAKRAAETFANASELTQDQRQKLMEIYSRTFLEARTIRTEMGQSKSLLFKLVATESYKSKDVQSLKNKIVALDQRRLNIMFKALADVQEVVGYGADKAPIYEHLRDYEINPATMLSITK